MQRADLLAQPQPHLGIQRRQRLIQQQQLGRGRQRTGERDTLLLAAGQLHRIFGALLFQADQRQQFGDAGGNLGFRPLLVDQTIGDIVGNRQVRKQRIGLEHDAEVALGRRRIGNVPPVHHDLA